MEAVRRVVARLLAVIAFSLTIAASAMTNLAHRVAQPARSRQRSRNQGPSDADHGSH